jgi:hypothetical protein
MRTILGGTAAELLVLKNSEKINTFNGIRTFVLFRPCPSLRRGLSQSQVVSWFHAFLVLCTLSWHVDATFHVTSHTSHVTPSQKAQKKKNWVFLSQVTSHKSQDTIFYCCAGSLTRSSQGVCTSLHSARSKFSIFVWPSHRRPILHANPTHLTSPTNYELVCASSPNPSQLLYIYSNTYCSMVSTAT